MAPCSYVEPLREVWRSPGSLRVDSPARSALPPAERQRLPEHALEATQLVFPWDVVDPGSGSMIARIARGASTGSFVLADRVSATTGWCSPASCSDRLAFDPAAVARGLH